MKDFIKEKYNLLIPAFLIIVILIALILYGREYKNNRYAVTDSVNVYQYFSGIKFDYVADISRNRKDVVIDFEPKDTVINLDSIPVYITDTDKVIFPKEMMAFFPIDNIGYKVNSLGEVYKRFDLYYLNQKDVNKSLDHVFYYDGRDLYFFIDEVTVVIGDKEINLSPMSYLNCSYQNLLEYYDKENDTYESISLTNERVYVKNKYMNVDVTLDKVIYNDGFNLLTSDFGLLNKISDISLD